MAPGSLHVVVLGATGLVGREILRAIEDLELPVASIRLLATERSAGGTLEFRGEEVGIEAAKEGAFRGRDIAFFAAGPEASRAWAERARAEGALVVDGSSAFRMEPDVPLVVPEVNAGALATLPPRGIVASPCAAVTGLAVVLAPLARAAGLERVAVTTLQAVAGLGQRGVSQLEREAQALLSGREPEGEGPIPHRIAFNLVPQVGAFADGTSEEEARMALETRKVLGEPGLRLTATAIRAPIFYGLAAAVNVAAGRKLSAAEAREILRRAPGLKVLDEPAERVYPMPMLATLDDAVHVGRIREDASQERGLDLFLVVDEIRKGAALNLVQIAEIAAARL
ncbi:MAG TPA: aspartate-semialdehyde dehydrogenase [Anaeromyxobacteraceae bacterium]|nr:aspartate-semialdehyde dehydrogenase [Anaeromyxobacteraceae bacterium]